MFDFVRKHTKIMQFLLFLLIVPSFVLFGLEGYSGFKEKGASVASVAGQEITQTEWDNAHKNEVERLRQTAPSLDVKLFDTPEARYATLERLIRDKVLAVQARQAKLLTSDQRLARDLQSNEAIASLRKPDGSLDMERYRQLVGAQGMTPELFEASVRADLSSRQVLAGVAQTGFSPNALADLALNAFFEQREIQVLRYRPADFFNQVNTDDAALQAFYQANPALFQAPEQADIEYLVLDLDAVKNSITLSESDLRAYYEQNAARLSGLEERRASHILIASPKSAAPAERQKAKAKADELLATVQKAPQSFADVAKKNSQDPGSASNGGDLDFFARGAMVKPFEDAAFSMKSGDISPVVETDFGYHIIKLTDIKLPQSRSFEEMKPSIETDLKKQQAQRKFAEIAETFTNAVYDQPDSLKPTAERLKLELKTASKVTRQPDRLASGLFANAKFLNAVFSPESVDKKRNTQAIETASNQLVAARIVKYTPARTQDFAEVKALVREQLLATQGAAMAAKEGAAQLAAFKAGSATTALSTALVVARDQSQKQPFKVVEAALRADPAALPAWVGVDVGSEGYAVVRVNKVVPRTPPPESVQQGRTQFSQWAAAAENQAYYNLLRVRHKTLAKVAEPTPKPDASAASGQAQ
ncbi:MAG: SurA N-terminal domain-containing protein [Burkholderiales bacterium]